MPTTHRYQLAYNELLHNRDLPKAGLSFREVAEKAKSYTRLSAQPLHTLWRGAVR